MDEYDIMNIVKDCLHKLCIHQPDNPVYFLKQYFSSNQFEQVRNFRNIVYRFVEFLAILTDVDKKKKRKFLSLLSSTYMEK